MTDSAGPLERSRRRPPVLAICSLALVVLPFILVAFAGEVLGFYMNFAIPVAWLASIVIGIVAAIKLSGRWRLAGILAIAAPAIEAIAVLALLVYGFSTV